MTIFQCFWKICKKNQKNLKKVLTKALKSDSIYLADAVKTRNQKIKKVLTKQKRFDIINFADVTKRQHRTLITEQ